MPSLIPLDSLLGVTFIGIIISSIIYGATCVQLYYYYTQNCTNDRPFLKALVATIWVIDSVHVAMLASADYRYTVTNFGDYLSLTQVNWSLVISVPLGSLLVTVVQMFFAYRVYQLSAKKRAIPIIIVFLSIAQFALCIPFAIVLELGNSITNLQKALMWTIISCSIAMAIDGLIALSMIYYLLRHDTTFQPTKNMVQLIIKYTINTGLLVTIFNLAALISAIASPVGNETYALFDFISIRLYACSFVSVLNSRQYISNKGQENEMVVEVSTFHASRQTLDELPGSEHQRGTEISIVGAREAGMGEGSKLKFEGPASSSSSGEYIIHV